MTALSSARSILKKKQLDAILFSSASHIAYLTDYTGFSATERDAYLLVVDNKCYLFTSPLYINEVKELTENIRIVENSAAKPFVKNLSEIITKEGLDRIGFESDDITVTEYLAMTENSNSRFISVDLTTLRIKKTDTETEKITKACAIADQALKQLKQKIKPGVTEMALALEFELAVRKLGGTLSFPTIVAFGKNSAVPHHHTDQTILKTNDVILIDCGVRLDNYCSDMTRTFFIGTPTKEQKKVYQTVEAAHRLAVDFIIDLLEKKKSINAAEVDDVSREYILSVGYPSIPHSLGHGIGIEVHEQPRLSPTSHSTLEEGMVFSIEPGIYLPDKFGVRIEDLYAIQDNKLIQLTQTSSAL